MEVVCMRICASLFSMSEFTSKTVILSSRCWKIYCINLVFKLLLTNVAEQRWQVSLLLDVRAVWSTICVCVCVCVSVSSTLIQKGKALMHTSIGVFFVGARWCLMTCNGIVVVSQFLREYFHPYPYTLFQGTRERGRCRGRGRGRGRG